MRRRPEDGVLHRVLREHLETFLEEVRARDGGGSLPEFIERELREFLSCGVLARGFARFRCDDWGHEILVAFSCKGRGFCPSCCGRRMADLAGHLSDNVLGGLPVRQWVPISWAATIGLRKADDRRHRRRESLLHRVGQRADRKQIEPQDGPSSGSTSKPSRMAASRNRSSKETNSRPVDSPRDQRSAAASWKASAALSV